MSLELISILKENKLFTESELSELLNNNKHTNHSLYQHLINKSIGSEKKLLSIIGTALTIPFEILDRSTIDIKTSKMIPETFSRKETLIPLFQLGNTLFVGFSTPFNTNAIEDIEAITQCNVMPIFSTKESIDDLITFAYSYQKQSSEKDSSSISSLFEMGLQIVEDPSTEETPIDIAQEAPISKLVNTIIIQAINEKASDIHIEPTETTVSIRFRVDGILKEIMSPPIKLAAPIISRIKILSELDITETRKPQDGRLSFPIKNKKIDFRISTIRTISGEKMVLRLLDKSDAFVSIEKLGLNKENYDLLENLTQSSSGIILVCGPTGSGKTSTLYSCLSKINNHEKNIITIEDPVEFNLEGINQIPVNPKIGVDFVTGLSAIVRQDPDIIMVGEIRDIETASIAIQAALTGHLVFSTVHTRNAAGSVTRLINMGVQPFLINSSFLGVVGQRLVRKICTNCKTEINPATYTEIKEKLIIKKLNEAYPSEKIHIGSGCKYCEHTGYKGRTGIFEILTLNEDSRELIFKKESSEKIQKTSIQHGMKIMIDDGIDKINQGITTIQEIARVIDV
jgi:type IV pilus assembly protein PilB